MEAVQPAMTALAPPPADEDLVLLRHLERADVPRFVTTAFLNELNLDREAHRRLVRAAAALVAAIDRHPGDTVPRDALAPALAPLRFHVFHDAPPPSTP